MKKIMLSMLAAMCMLGLTGCVNADSSSAPAETALQQEIQTEQPAEDTEAEKPDEDKAVSGQTEKQPENPDTAESSGKDTIVVYFSATGTTKGVAERIANVTNADLYETTIEMNDQKARPAIANDTVDLNGYTTVYIGYPIWWGDAPRIMSTFVEAHGFDGKTVIPFCTSGGSGIGRSGSNLASQAGSGNWLDGDRLDAGISESRIQDWINSMN